MFPILTLKRPFWKLVLTAPCLPLVVETMEGTMRGKSGDWLMVGVNGEMYPCDKDIFEKTYTFAK